MGVLSELQPKKVFEYFEEICNIPHGSGNVEQISDYLVKFAKDRNLEVIQDEFKNVIIIREATPGFENEPAVIIQGHMDMVAVHKPELCIDMTKEPLKVGIDGDNIYAEGTSLGGDDGIAVAYALAILDSNELSHPRLEVVITVDEEVGMDGARGIDLSMLKGNRLLNLDSEEEGIFWVSCAGGGRIGSILEYEASEMAGVVYQLTISGLTGGHSGAEIHKERGNSNILCGRFLWKLASKVSFGLISTKGGVADNAICRETIAEIVLNKEDVFAFTEAVKAFEAEIKVELATKDSGVYVKAEALGTDTKKCVCGESLKRVCALLYSLPNGVQAMSADIAGLVETSLNMGILEITPEKFLAEFAVRSSVESAKYALVDKVKAVTALAGGYTEETGDYPGWAYRVDSPLRDKMAALYEEMYGEKPQIAAIHAGLECGLLAGKIDDLDCVSFGPNMKDIHTTEETLSISSTRRVWEFLVQLLAKRG
ncbi:MAG: aminoacyl-histidine dipeptidase [Lachnospiraceae bacterium]|nr:aminoacyl-histidine dipeptidase [Lachnospiraceae bacterium]